MLGSHIPYCFVFSFYFPTILFFQYHKAILRWQVQYQVIFFSIKIVLKVSTKCLSVDLEGLEVLQGAIHTFTTLIDSTMLLRLFAIV